VQRYWVESEDLWSADERGVVWRGRPDGKPVQAAVGIPGTDDAAVLLDVEAGPRDPLGHLKTWPHLVRVRPNGDIVWRLAATEASGERDCWTSVHAVDASLVVTTQSAQWKTIEAATGRVLTSVAT
jgi:hypothetical protein